MEIWQEIRLTFWSPSIWLPPNIEWADIEPGSQPDVTHTDYRDLWWSLPMALALFTIQYCIERYIFRPFGVSLGLKSKQSNSPAPNAILEAAYQKFHRIDAKTRRDLTKRVDLTECEIERWWHNRRAQDKPTNLTKFCESASHSLYCAISSGFGVFILWDKPWLWDFEHCWHGYPHHSIDPQIRSYYMISTSLYLSAMVSQYLYTKREDYWEMFVHHITALLLLSMSWICNLHRVGLLVLVILDFPAMFLEASKMAIYANRQKLCYCLSCCCLISWIVARLGIFARLIYSACFEAPKFIKGFPVVDILRILLLLLLLMNFAWTCTIFKFASNSLKLGKNENSCRSSSAEFPENVNVNVITTKKKNVYSR